MHCLPTVWSSLKMISQKVLYLGSCNLAKTWTWMTRQNMDVDDPKVDLIGQGHTQKVKVTRSKNAM